MEKIPQSREDLVRHLGEQAEFIRASAKAFDAGFHAEAKRMAVSLRILVHDTKNSHSVYSQIGGIPDRWLDTTGPTNPTNLLHECNLVGMRFSDQGAQYFAMLDNRPFPDRWIPFTEWWESDIYRAQDRKVLSRRNLVLSICNKDGGAHVDPSLNAEYEALSRSQSLGVYYGIEGTAELVLGAELHAMRQVAHEYLRTIDAE